MATGDETETLPGEPTGTTPSAEGAPGSGSRELSLPPGECLGRYTIREKVGRGAFGDVFAAHDPELDRTVALKVLRPGLAGESPEGRARFQREAQAMARLSHPNVVTVYDVGTFADRVYVAMELVEGPTLAAWLAERPRTWREVVDVMVQAGRGLEAAHRAGLVHRDFKPANVLVGDRVRVADFGLARAADDVEAATGGASRWGSWPRRSSSCRSPRSRSSPTGWRSHFFTGRCRARSSSSPRPNVVFLVTALLFSVAALGLETTLRNAAAHEGRRG